MDKLEELQKLEEFRLAELLHALNREDVLYRYPELGKAYADYMDAVSNTHKYCRAQIAAHCREHKKSQL